MTIPESKLRWRYYGGGMAVVAIVIGLFLGSIFLAVGYFVWQTEEDYGKHGVAATGAVTRKDSKTEKPRPGQRGGPKTIYTVHYRYQDDQGLPHEGGDQVENNEWNRLQKDQRIQIEYLQNQPGTSRITEGRSFWSHYGYLLALAGGGFLVGATLILGIGGWVWAGRKARLVRDGDPFLGTVTDHDTRNPGRGKQAPSVRLRFAFTDAAGAERTGKSCWLPSKVAPRWPLDEQILVLQDRSNPARFEADIFEARPDDLAELQEDSPAE